MTGVDWIGFALASIALVLTPGPGFVCVAKASGSGGARVGRRAALGIVAGDTGLILLSLVGVSALFRAHPAFFHAVRLCGAGYLIFLGLQSIITKPERLQEDRPGKALPPFRHALTITLLNPKAVFFFMAFFPAFIRSTERGLVIPYAGMTLLFMAISITYLLAVSHIASRVGRAFQQSRRIRTAARKVCGCLFVGFGVKVALVSK